MSFQKSKVNDKTTVTVKAIAYYKMLVHVLRFGSKTRDQRQFKEVMGILIGRLEGQGEIKNVIVEDAVPISHGGSIEVAFKPEDYVSFSAVDASYAEKDPPLFSCGWYHSHPSLKIFFSSTDIKNQLGWQTPNPSAIGIVFDHTYLETQGDMGFRTFRLDNPAKGPMSDYHEVKTTVEIPNTLEFYLKLYELINSIHSKEPPLLEINETPDLFGEIMLPGQSQMMSKQPEIELTELMTALKNGLSSFIESSFEPLVRFLNTWSQDVVKKLAESNIQMRTDLVELKDTLSNGVNNLQSNFKMALMTKTSDLETYITDRFEEYDKASESIRNNLNQIKKGLIEQIDKLFDDKIKVIIDPILKELNENKNVITDNIEKSKDTIVNIDQQQSSLKNLTDKVKSLENATIEKVKTVQESVKKKILDKTNLFTKNVSDLSKQVKDLSSDLDAALSILENTKQTLQTKIKSSGGVK